MGYADFSQQFIQNALAPTSQTPYTMPYNSWSPAIQQAYNATAPAITTLGTQQQSQQPGQPAPTNNPQSVLTSSGQNNTTSQPVDPYASLKSDINNSYNSYFQQLDNIFSQSLPEQRQAQEGIVNSQYQQGVNDLTTQEAQSLSDLGIAKQQAETTQGKNLKSLAEDVRNSMKAANVYLGARGAGDSSATNQYAYAIGKEANKNRTNLVSNYANIQNELVHKEFLVKSTVQNEMRRLDSQRNQNLLSISNWFSSQQMQLQQAKANGQLARDSDMRAISKEQLNLALSALQQQQQNYLNQKNALLSWATARSNDVTSLKANIAAMSQFLPSMPEYQGINVQPQTSQRAPVYVPGNLTDNTKENIFGGSGTYSTGATGGW